MHIRFVTDIIHKLKIFKDIYYLMNRKTLLSCYIKQYHSTKFEIEKNDIYMCLKCFP